MIQVFLIEYYLIANFFSGKKLYSFQTFYLISHLALDLSYKIKYKAILIDIQGPKDLLSGLKSLLCYLIFKY